MTSVPGQGRVLRGFREHKDRQRGRAREEFYGVVGNPPSDGKQRRQPVTITLYIMVGVYHLFIFI